MLWTAAARSLALALVLTLGVTLLAGAQTARQASRVWTQADGTVEKLDGTTLTFRLDDGRRVKVDVSRMSPLERAALTSGERTALIGYTDPRLGMFVAWFLPVAETAPAAASPTTDARTAAAAPAPRVDPRAWRIAHGKVDRIDRGSMVLTTDEGATVFVDVAAVDPAVVRALAGGERVTVLGFQGDGPDRLEARFIHRDAAEPRERRSIRSDDVDSA